jgi:small subunit ribosomal protein S4
VLHRHVAVNGRVCNIPSILLKEGDTVSVIVRERSRRKGAAGGGEGSKRKRNMPAVVRQYIQDTNAPPPDWLQRVSADPPEGKVARLPMRQDVDPRIKDDIREQLIIELCSR